MDTELAHCPACDTHVRVGLTPAPLHEGHATLPDAPELVCLHVSERCGGGRCPLTNLPTHVMALRLARSHLPDEAGATTRMRCDGCGGVEEMRVVDRGRLLCPLCGTVNRWILLELMGRGWVAIGRAEGPD